MIISRCRLYYGSNNMCHRGPVVRPVFRSDNLRLISSFMSYQHIYNPYITWNAISGSGSATTFWTPEFSPVLCEVRFFVFLCHCMVSFSSIHGFVTFKFSNYWSLYRNDSSQQKDMLKWEGNIKVSSLKSSDQLIY